MGQNKLEVFYEGKPCYEILLEQDYWKLKEAAAKLELGNRKVCIVTDSKVGPLYAEEVINALQGSVAKMVSFPFAAGEESKNLNTVQELYEFLIQEGFDRNDCIAALGGGVVGDLAGYAAATYLRGIRFFQLPTSLLSMVDSSIGGKTGVDFKAYKNMVGAFYMPQFVYINISVLNSLPDREYYSGFGEIIKHGLIKDEPLYQWLGQERDALLSKDLGKVTEMVYRSLLVKKAVVEKDPKEKGERALLNFGHTLGHAVEKLKDFKLLHGECVSIGIAASVRISQKRGLISEAEQKGILDILTAYHLPVSADGITKAGIIDAAAKDKKMDAQKIKFILLRKIGDAVIDASVSKEEMEDACEFILKEDRL